jgi:hypothetical protein
VNATHPDAAKDARRRDRAQLEHALRAAGGDVIRGNAVRCPFHDDRHASASLYADEQGVWRVKCHTCKTAPMDVFDVTEAHTGRAVGDQLRELRPGMVRKPARVFADLEAVVASLNAYTHVERVHAYTNPDTKTPDLLVVRARDRDGGKTFQQFQPNPGGGFISGAPPKPWPLYNRTVLRAAKAVVVVEGEKCVEALRAAGVPATSAPCGAGKAVHADWRPLAGLTVYLWPDHDPAGADHMRDVAAELAKVRPLPRVYRLDPAGLELPPKADAVEYLERLPADDDKADAVWEMLEARAEPTGPAAEVGELIEDMISGKWRALEWKFRTLGRLSKALFPGTTTLVCGDPGSTKSFLLLECLAHWHAAGIPVACYMLEDTKRIHLLRALAQMSGEGRITDDDWVRNHPAVAREIYAQHREALDTFGACITSPGANHPTTDEIAAWVEARCKDGCQIIAVDPITCADFSDKPWKDDRRFIWTCQRALAFSGARLILVTHPRKGAGGAKSTGSMDDMAGGASYPRHAQTVLWVQRKDPAEEVEIVSGSENTMNKREEVDRVVKIVKSRNGKGHGAALAFNFLTESLTFEEVGLINGKAKAQGKAREKTSQVVDPFAPTGPVVRAPVAAQQLDLDELP